MTLLCAPISIDSSEQAQADARSAHLAGADLIEYRVDAFFNPDDDYTRATIAAIVNNSPLPCIVTCRITAEGGDFDGDDADRAELFEMLTGIQHPPRYFDVELASLERSDDLQRVVHNLASRHAAGEATPRLILSMHDFDQRPADLSRRLERLRAREDAAIIKIAYRARSLRDNLELFELLRERDRPTIALGMGEFGLLSRVLAPKFGGFLTFAALRPEAATAPGQPTVAEMLSLYRVRSITKETRVCGVIGWPVGHSLSPQVHNAGFEAVGFDGVYAPLPVPPEWEHFKATVGALVDAPALDFIGASVTIPHKEHLVRLAHERDDEGWEIDDWSRAAGAANTLIRRSDSWRITNTDAPAINDLLREALGAVRDRRVVILGAGGVARAAAAAMARDGASVTIVNRTAGRAAALVDELAELASSHGGAVESVSPHHLSGLSFDAIINATSVGMAGGDMPDASAIDLTPFQANAAEKVVFDTVYTPRVTPLLAQAQSLGFRTITGADLFVRQAALQCEAWTGKPAPLALFKRIVSERDATA